MRRYTEVAEDPDVPALVEFYKSYRAVVRSKVAALAAADPAVDDLERGQHRREAMRYVQLAAAYDLPPALVLMCGLPACGKSWLAKHLARPLRAAVLQSDVRRKVLSGIAPKTDAHEEYETGLYTPENKERTYHSLLDGALRNLRMHHSVILDATFSKHRHRALFADAAAELGLPYFVVHVSAPDEVIRERLAQRENDAHEVSDAGLDVYTRERSSFEPLDAIPRGHVIESASGVGSPEEQSSMIIDRMIALLAGRPA